MTKLPQFVRSRLAHRQMETGGHPPADALARFAGQTLGARERADLLEHLAQCPECREVLAAASVREVGTAPGVAWWKWRWATAAAVACLVAALFWKQGSFENSPRNTILSAPAAPAAPREEHPKTPKPDSGQTVRNRPAKKRLALRLDTHALPKQPVAEVEPAPVRPQTVIVPPSEPNDAVSQASFAPEPQRTGAAEPPQNLIRPDRSNFILRSGLRASAAKDLAGQTFKAHPAKSLWNLDGALRKSDDGGKIWRTIHVDDQARLYALSAAGSSVWVGGADGALFHSVDDGLSWSRVVVVADDAALTGTITRIDARDENWVRLKTRSGDWLTTDGGLHWRRD